MKSRDVAKSYDSIADRWNSDDFPRSNGIEQHKRALAFLGQGSSALDIGCGSSGRLIDLFIESGLEPEGLDLSDRMIELARLRHPQVTFYHTDICDWAFPRQYDFISGWDSIWHISLEQQESVLKKIMVGLAPGGVFIFTTGGVDEPSETRDSAMGPPMYHSAPGIPNILAWLDDSGCICRHLEYDQHPERHVYIIAQKNN